MTSRSNEKITSFTRLSVFLTIFALSLVSGAAYASDPVKGGKTYSMRCAACHGATGTSMMPGTPSFARGDRMVQPDSVLLSSIRDGKNAMPAFRGMLTDNDILDVIAFLRTLH